MEDRRSPICAVDARVVSRSAPCRDHVCLELELDARFDATPGQFLQISCHAPEAGADRVVEWRENDTRPQLGPWWHDRQAFLRRPFSIADSWRQRNTTHVVLISRAVGPGTRWLDRLAGGQTVNVTGPLGNGFSAPPPTAQAVLVGGGVGIPPLLFLARRLHERGHALATLFFGAASADLVPVPLTQAPDRDAIATRCLRLFGDAPYPAVVSTNDGSLGTRGHVTDALSQWLSGRDATGLRVFACGPPRMLQAVAALTRRWNVACELCIERTMGCGLGTCLSCVLRVRDRTRPAGWRWALACLDGPVFERDTLLDDA
jgi:dihydroorotate dehydrogenase electron transfer subunit